jgi:ABC-type polysaccharide/polyol phosphate export permease
VVGYYLPHAEGCYRASRASTRRWARTTQNVTATLAEYRSHRELLSNLTLRELRSKYKRSALGWAWSTINPLVYMAVYTVVFQYFMGIRIQSTVPPPSGLNVYALFLLCAMLPFSYFQNSVMGSLGSLTGNSNLIKKTYFPRELLPASVVIANLVSHAIEMALLLVALLAFGDWRALVYLPLTVVFMLLLAVFALGLGLAMSALNVYFRDIEHFMGILFLVWFFMTPIVYSFATLGSFSRSHPWVIDVLKLNPMTDATLCFRNTLYNGMHPGWLQFAYFAVFSIVTFFVGRAVFNRLEGGLAEEL